MKKQLLFGWMLSMSIGAAFAQQGREAADCVATFEKGKVGHTDQFTSKAAPFWTEDFGGGMPAGWAVIDSSGICPWVYSMDGSWGYYNGNSGTSGAAGINSTTGANGFLICDADSANHFTYGQPSGSTYQYLSSYIMTTPINCSTHPSVVLKFEQFFRYNNSVPMNVRVSNDGINWVNYNVSGGLSNNSNSANPDIVEINISPTAANQATVYIMFGWSARVYYWMIDDISLSEEDPYDIKNLNSWWGVGNDQDQYYRIPLSQNPSISFHSELENNTVGTINDIYSDVTVSNPSVVFSGTSPLAPLSGLVYDTFTVSTQWAPAAIGVYNVDFTCGVTGQTDGNMANNDQSDIVEITNDLYALDNVTDSTMTSAGISNWSGNTGGEFKIGNIYEILKDDAIECVEIGITDAPENANHEIFAEVYVYNTGTSAWDLRGYSNTYFLTSGDLNSIISIPLFQAANFTAGETALVVAGHYGGAVSGADDVEFMYGQPVNPGMVWGFDALGDDYYLGNPRAIVVRANFNCGLGIEENTALEIGAYPNPFGNELTVNWSNAEEVGLKLVDLAGRTVLSTSAKGTSTTLATDAIAEGVYTLVVQTGSEISTTRVVLNR